MVTKLPNGESIELKYLFEVEYLNGETYKQNAEDQSPTDPQRSCFFDVRIEEIKRFKLVGEGREVVVDLTDGHFEVDGLSFLATDEELFDFRVMYYRVRDIHFDIGMNYRSNDIAYRIGWQANTKDGKNRKRFIQIN